MPLPPHSIVHSHDNLFQRSSFCHSCQINSLKPQSLPYPILKRSCPNHNVLLLHVASFTQPFGPDVVAGVGIDFGHPKSSRNKAIPVPKSITVTNRNPRATVNSAQVYAVLQAIQNAKQIVLGSLREIDRHKMPGCIRSMVGQISDEIDLDLHAIQYSHPMDVKEIIIFSSSNYFFNGLTLEHSSKPWSFVRPGYNHKMNHRSKNVAARLTRSRKYTFTGSVDPIPAEIVTNYKPNKWFKQRRYPAVVDWDTFKEIEREIVECNNNGVLISFVKVKKESRGDTAVKLAMQGSTKRFKVLMDQ